ncbi:MAG: carbohydrate kinase family protein [Defluviitaleaceae bacterium]|nr:carbohydrate kinase family protein [Defluviitaleaceae bacterium]
MNDKIYDVIGIDAPCVDLNLNIARFPVPGAGEGVRRLSWQGGGKIATGLAACARLGAKCAMMGRVGGDMFGNFIIKDLQLHGVDTSGMKVSHGDSSSLSVVLSDLQTASRTFLFTPGDAPRLAFEEIDPDLLRSAAYFFICYADEAIERAVDTARAAGVSIFIDADVYSEDIAALIPKIDVFVGSEAFYGKMYGNKRGEDDCEANCRAVMDKGPRIVIFTFGENGCAGVSGDGFFRLPAFPVEAVDTVGAGDVFHGAFLAGLLRGMSAKEAARFASAAAAIKCTRIGGRAGIPDIKTLERFLRDGAIDYTEIDKRVKFYERGLENVR